MCTTPRTGLRLDLSVSKQRDPECDRSDRPKYKLNMVQDLDVRSHLDVCKGLAKSGLWPPAQTSKRSHKTRPKLWKQPKSDGRVRSGHLVSFYLGKANDTFLLSCTDSLKLSCCLFTSPDKLCVFPR